MTEGEPKAPLPGTLDTDGPAQDKAAFYAASGMVQPESEDNKALAAVLLIIP